jgi:hypothetical protein
MRAPKRRRAARKEPGRRVDLRQRGAKHSTPARRKTQPKGKSAANLQRTAFCKPEKPYCGHRLAEFSGKTVRYYREWPLRRFV